MSRVGSTFANVRRSGVREMLERALERPGTVHLELGDPDFSTPSHIVDAAARAAAEGFTHYTPAAGLPSLRDAIARKVAAVNGLEATAAQIVVTTGACGALYALLRVLLDPGDAVLVPDPGWSGYAAIAGTLGAGVQRYALDRSRSFGLDLAAVEAALTPETRVIVVNSPGNPAGNVFAADELAALVALADRNDAWVVSDEAYESYLFDGEHVSPAAGGGPVLSVFTCSKSYAMTGWRVGYVVAPEEIASLVARAQESIVTSVSSVSQKAAEAALSGRQECVQEMRSAYLRRLRTATAILDAAGVGYVAPRGAFYLLVDVAAAEPDSRRFALSLLDDDGVAVVPGSAFGAEAEGLVRVSLCASDEAVREGTERLAAAIVRGRAA